MRHLVIITRETGEYDTFWSFNQNHPETIVTDSNMSLLVIKKSRLNTFVSYAKGIITDKLSDKVVSEIGILFHSLNDDDSQNKIVASFSGEIQNKIAFCKWYSGNKTDFWNAEPNYKGIDKPYNNLIKAWKDNNGSSKEDSFNAVWKYFLGDTKEEELTEAIFNTIYGKENDDAIEKSFSGRDKHLKSKSKK